MVCLDNKQPNSEPHSWLCVISSPLAWGISNFSKYKFTLPSFLVSMHHPNPVLYTEVSHFSIKKWVTELTCFMSGQWCQKSQVISGSQTEIRGDCFFLFPSPEDLVGFAVSCSKHCHSSVLSTEEERGEWILKTDLQISQLKCLKVQNVGCNPCSH